MLFTINHSVYPWIVNTPWRRERPPTPVFLPGESHGQKSLAGYSPWGHKESDMPEEPSMRVTHTHTHTHTHTQHSDCIHTLYDQQHTFHLAMRRLQILHYLGVMFL